MRRLVLVGVGFLLAAGSAAGQNDFLVVVADDVGVDRIGVYGEHQSPARTPNIDRLAASGVLFRRAWANPTCSPTRAALMTGRYAFRTGIGNAVRSGEPSLPPEEVTIAEMLTLGNGSYASVALGKWHLSDVWQDLDHPRECGFLHYSGSLGPLRAPGGEADYFRWTKIRDGIESVCETYATTDTTDEAIEMVRSLPEPWFLLVGYNAAHPPLHAPPRRLHDEDLRGGPAATPAAHHKAMVQALDTELGRLLDAIPPDVRARTTIVFLGDNGTPGEAVEPPCDPARGKGTLYESGIRVPLVVAGPCVSAPGSECAALVSVADVYATIAELAGIDLGRVQPADRALDSVSLVPYLEDPFAASIRSTLYAERFRFDPGEPSRPHRAVFDGRYKLIEGADQSRRGRDRDTDFVDRLELYDLPRDPLERDDLLRPGRALSAEENEACARLFRAMVRMQRE